MASGSVAHDFGPSTKYDLLYKGARYPPKAVVGIAARGVLGTPLNHGDFSGGESAGAANARLESLGFDIVPKVSDDPVEAELARRCALMDAVIQSHGASSVPTVRLKELRIYRGQAGICRDSMHTNALGRGAHGIAMTLAPLGKAYPHDLTDDWLLYHYPVTGRAGASDANEVESVKEAKRLGLPLFVVSPTEGAKHLRDIRWGEPIDWDDTTTLFKVRLHSASSEPPPLTQLPKQPVDPFVDSRPTTRQEVERRRRSPSFRFEVLRRFGCQCALCSISIKEVIDAAHVVPVEYKGSDSLNNGIPLCKTHHAAFDRGLIRIEPQTHNVIAGHSCVSLAELHVERTTLDPRFVEIANAALEWRWNNTEKIKRLAP